MSDALFKRWMCLGCEPGHRSMSATPSRLMTPVTQFSSSSPLEI